MKAPARIKLLQAELERLDDEIKSLSSDGASANAPVLMEQALTVETALLREWQSRSLLRRLRFSANLER